MEDDNELLNLVGNQKGDNKGHWLLSVVANESLHVDVHYLPRNKGLSSRCLALLIPSPCGSQTRKWEAARHKWNREKYLSVVEEGGAVQLVNVSGCQGRVIRKKDE